MVRAIQRKCNVCGKTYKACITDIEEKDGKFHWQRVACSRECGEQYLAELLGVPAEDTNNTETKPDSKEQVTE